MRLTTRQLEVAALVAKGYSDKKISHETNLSPATVRAHIRNAASRIPGPGPPRYKLLFLMLTQEVEP